MGVFRFKHFSVVNERSAMKVNTDGVLLGVCMTLSGTEKHLLDIGTGTGTIALIAAQRLASYSVSGRIIQAIDIDLDSAEEAATNFAASPWASFLSASHCSIADFKPEVKYDLIFSNPPYFDDSLQAPQQKRNNARHTQSGLSYRELIDFAVNYLEPCGRIAMVLPSDEQARVLRYARGCGLHLGRIVKIRTVPRKEPSRIIIEFSRLRCEEPVEDEITIQSEGKYTQKYLSLTRDFYLFSENL